MGQPSLDEVFFALTGRRRRRGANEGHRMTDPASRAAAVERPAARALGAVERADLRLARDAQVQARARAAVRPGHDADHVHAALHLRVRRRARRIAGRVPPVLPARHPGADGDLHLGLFRHGPVDRPRKGLFDRFRSLPIWPLAPFAGLMVGDILRHLIAGGDHPRHRPHPRLPARGGGAGVVGGLRCCSSPSASAWAGSSSSSAC